MSHQHREILVADDDACVRLTLGDLLQRRGFAVSLAASGDEAVRSIERQPFDVLVLELVLPGPSCDEIIARAGTAQPHAPIIILTGYGWLDIASDDGAHSPKSVPVGVFDCLLKTADPQTVLERVEAALRERQRCFLREGDQRTPGATLWSRQRCAGARSTN